MTAERVLICGAGIAGMTAAYWLARAGFSVTIVELSAGSRTSGNPVDVRGAAATVAHEMGIWPQLEHAATETHRLTFVDAQGHRRAQLRTRRSSSRQKEIEIARSDLAAALMSVADPTTEIIVADTITELRPDPGGVDVEFRVTAPRRFDLVLGADGLHSTVRRLAFGPESGYTQQFGMYVGTMRTAIDVADPGEVLMYNEPDLSLSFHPAGGKPLAALIFRTKKPYDYHDSDAAGRLIEDAYSAARWVAAAVLDEWRATPDVYFDSVTRVAMPHWSQGRVALVGDAADCLSMFGDGSSNAIVAAKTLADAITCHSGDYRVAFASYEHAHRSRLRSSLRPARVGSRLLVPSTRGGIMMRNRAIRAASMFGRGRPQP